MQGLSTEGVGLGTGLMGSRYARCDPVRSFRAELWGFARINRANIGWFAGMMGVGDHVFIYMSSFIWFQED